MGHMNIISVVVLVFTYLHYHFASAEIYSSLSHTERILGIEIELADALENYIQEEEQRLHKLKLFSHKLRRTVEHVKKSGAKFLEHPVNSYLLIKRFVTEWPQIDNIITTENPAEGKKL